MDAAALARMACPGPNSHAHQWKQQTSREIPKAHLPGPLSALGLAYAGGCCSLVWHGLPQTQLTNMLTNTAACVAWLIPAPAPAQLLGLLLAPDLMHARGCRSPA